MNTRLSPSSAKTVRDGKRLFVLCPCGKECDGEFFHSVRSGLKGDAWTAFRRHWSRSHGPYPYHPAAEKASRAAALARSRPYAELVIKLEHLSDDDLRDVLHAARAFSMTNCGWIREVAIQAAKYEQGRRRTALAAVSSAENKEGR